MNCTLIWIGEGPAEPPAGGRYTCTTCGIEGTTRQTDLARVNRICRPKRPPSAPRRLANFTVAAIGHFLAGSPTCSQAKIDRRLAICQSCPLFLADPKDPQAGVCGHEKCGCTLKNVRTYLSKLAWADQQCPDGRWGPETI